MNFRKIESFPDIDPSNKVPVADEEHELWEFDFSSIKGPDSENHFLNIFNPTAEILVFMMKFQPLQDPILPPEYQYTKLPIHFYILGGELGRIDRIRHDVRSAIIETCVPDIDFFDGPNLTFNPVRQIVAGRVRRRVVDAFAKAWDKHNLPDISDMAFKMDYDMSVEFRVSELLESTETQIHSAVYNMYHPDL